MARGQKKKPIAKPQTNEELMLAAAATSSLNVVNDQKNLATATDEVSRIKTQMEQLAKELQEAQQKETQYKEGLKKSQGAAAAWGHIVCSIKEMSFEDMETIVGLALVLANPTENPIIHDFLSELQENGHEQLKLDKYAEQISNIRKSGDFKNSETLDDASNIFSSNSNEDGA